MKKIILIFVLLISFYSYSFADTWDINLLKYKVDSIQEINKDLLKNNSDLEKKYSEFNFSLDNYLKQVKLKEDAYDLALNQLKYWVWWIWTLIAILFWWLAWFWFKGLLEFKNELSSQIRAKIEDIFTKDDHNITRQKILDELKDKIEIESIIKSEFDKLPKNDPDSLISNQGFIVSLAQELFDDKWSLKRTYIIKESKESVNRVKEKLKK